MVLRARGVLRLPRGWTRQEQSTYTGDVRLNDELGHLLQPVAGDVHGLHADIVAHA